MTLCSTIIKVYKLFRSINMDNFIFSQYIEGEHKITKIFGIKIKTFTPPLTQYCRICCKNSAL